jgi:hypothetical protein
MCDTGAELDVVFAQPEFQHRQQSSTNGLTRQDTRNAMKEQNMTEKQESDATLPRFTCRLRQSGQGSA